MTLTGADSTAVANDVFGQHPGYRALHAKGTLLKGTFTSSAEVGSLTRARHMQGEPVPVTVRVSNGFGNPNAPDYSPDVRGLAVKFYLPDGTRTDIVAQTAPRFPVHTPEAFLELLRAQKPGPSMTWRMPLWFARHPEAIKGLPPNVQALRPPESYATATYFAIHAFRFVDGAASSRYVRYTFQPEAGDRRIGPREAKRLGRDYLQEEIKRRIVAGPIRFRLELQIAGPGDDVDDPMSVWPAERQRVTAGTLELTGLETERETGGDVLVFDPTRVVDGVELSNDPVLLYRHDAYSDSVAQRTRS